MTSESGTGLNTPSCTSPFSMAAARARGVGDDPHHDGVEVRLALVPVVGVLLQADEVALLPLLEDERPRADRRVQGGMGGEVLALVDVLGQHLRLVRAERGQQHRRGLRQPHHHRAGIGRVDRGDLAEGDPAARVELLPDLLERELDVGRGERLAVVPGHAAPQLEGVGLAVGRDAPGLGQAGARLEIEVVLEQPFVDLRGDGPDEGGGVDTRDQRGRLRALHDGERAAGARLGRGGQREAREEREQRGEHGEAARRQDWTTHDGPPVIEREVRWAEE